MKAFLSATKAGVPLVAISTPDAAATIAACLKSLNGSASKVPQLQWNIVEGLSGMNDLGKDLITEDEPEPGKINRMQTLNPVECLSALATCAKAKVGKSYPLAEAVVFLHMSNRLLEAERVEGLGFAQGVWLCRDSFKAIAAMLVLLGPSITLPAELKQDVVVIDEPLPDDEELGRICKSITDDAGIKVDEKDAPKAVSTLRGLSAFAAEQVTAMSITKAGLDIQEMMKLKRGYIGQMPGIEVREDKITFDDIAGYENVKNILRLKLGGKRPPQLILWMDEVEKAFAGSETDTSGTTQDQVGCILTWVQDRLNEDRLSAIMLMGFPGTAKSMNAMALRNEAKCECLRMDLGGMKDSLVGSSEKRIRNVLKVVDAMSGGHILVVATCNSIKNIPSPFISRFALGTYFFDLPSSEELAKLWALKIKKYGLPDQPAPDSDGWTGREVNQCAFLANDLNIPLKEAAQYIMPFCSTGSAEIKALRDQAHKRFLSATTPGFYMKPAEGQAVTGRRITV